MLDAPVGCKPLRAHMNARPVRLKLRLDQRLRSDGHDTYPAGGEVARIAEAVAG
jgi:hypothetical protein